MRGKLVAEVKLIHAGEPTDSLRKYGSMLDTHLKLPGQVDYDMNPDTVHKDTPVSPSQIHRQLKLVEDRQRLQDDERGQSRAVVIYSELFLRVIESQPNDAKKILVLLHNCLVHGYVAEIVQGNINHQHIEGLFRKFGVEHPPQCKMVSSDNYIGNMDHGALAEAVYKQWFGQDALLSEAYGGGGGVVMVADDGGQHRNYQPETVHIIQHNLNKEDVIRPLGRAFEDKLEDVDYKTCKTKNSKDPSKVILRDMREVRNDCEEEKTHGVLMWDANMMQLLEGNTKAKTQVEEILLQDDGLPRQFANVLMAGVELSQFQTFAPSLYNSLKEPNRVVRWNNYLGKDGFSMDFQQLAIAVYKVWTGAQPSGLGAQPSGSKSTENKKSPSAMSPTNPLAPITRVVGPIQRVEPIQRSAKEPVESYDSFSSLEMDLEAISDPANVERHSMEVYGPRSRGQSSEGSSRNTATSQPRDAADGLPAAPRRPETTVDGGQHNQVPESRPIQQVTSLGVDSNGRLVTSGGNNSFTQREAIEAQQHDEVSLHSVDQEEARLASLDATISQVALPSSAESSLHKPGSLRGPSYQEEKRNQPIGQPQPSNGGDNKVACTGFDSVPMDKRVVIPGNAATTNNAAQIVPGCHKPPAAAQKAPPTQSAMQAKSKDDGHKISLEANWKQPRNKSSGSLLLGDQNLQNKAVNGDGPAAASSAQLRPEVRGQQRGGDTAARRYNTEPVAPMCNGTNSVVSGDEPRQATNSLPSMALPGHPHNRVSLAVGAEGNNSLLRKLDERDNQDRACQNHLNERQPADGQYFTQQQPPLLPSQPQQQPQRQSEKDVGLLRGEADNPSRPADAPPPYTEDPSPGFMSLQPERPYSELKSNETSVSVPTNFKLNMDTSKQEGQYNKDLKGTKFGQNGYKHSNSSESTGSSDPSDSNNQSIDIEVEEDVIDKSLLRNIDPSCVQRVKIVLDPLKTIVADWRNIAGKYGIKNELITYWRSQPVKGQGPTEHLLEHLADQKRELTINEFKETLTFYKRFDVLEIFKKHGY